MRNSSLDEWKSAEDITELKLCTEVADLEIGGRGAFYTGRSGSENDHGLYRSENVGMSNDAR